MEIISVSNVKWFNSEHTMVVADVIFEEFPDGIPIGGSADADTTYGVELWTKANAGDYGEIGAYVAPAPLVPQEISPTQLFLQLNIAGFITEQEALDAATSGAVPAAIDSLFATLPAADALAARVRWARMTTCLRTDPLVSALAAANSLTPEQVDQFFIDASKL